MALFECCSKQFVKDTGRSTLHPVIDLNTSSRCNILSVVVKKKSRWCWKPVKYLPTPFTLNEILTKVSCQNCIHFSFMEKFLRELKLIRGYRIRFHSLRSPSTGSIKRCKMLISSSLQSSEVFERWKISAHDFFHPEDSADFVVMRSFSSSFVSTLWGTTYVQY